MQRIAIGLEYDGTGYCGWQRQPTVPTLEATVVAALSRVADEPLTLVCAGRTDAGVHALCQVVHFDTSARRTRRAWMLGANTYLPRDVRVLWARPVPLHFHARFSAEWRQYRYLILSRPSPSALLRERAAWVVDRLDLRAMRRAARYLLGEHDFATFRSAECQSRSTRRSIERLEVERDGDYIVVTVRANAFLHHMARNLVGLLLAIGRGEYAPLDAKRLLAARDRRLAPPTAPAHGLYLEAVGYPPAFGLPSGSSFRSAMI
ncbi:MAG: tRNA pseudouridine(38-40) synthase TruA [Steroidobacteraceae bacterium]|nr:tRNA pseudouridine(38-40) synthase TruA [Steroidobacteraceae bacterium]MDW8259941.1 tRNA pseudouridine(38-40) synthase TruA [Gammaproteobacteria bacterium]